MAIKKELNLRKIGFLFNTKLSTLFVSFKSKLNHHLSISFHLPFVSSSIPIHFIPYSFLFPSLQPNTYRFVLPPPPPPLPFPSPHPLRLLERCVSGALCVSPGVSPHALDVLWTDLIHPKATRHIETNGKGRGEAERERFFNRAIALYIKLIKYLFYFVSF